MGGGTTWKGEGCPELKGRQGGVLGRLQAILDSGFQAGDTYRPVAAEVSPDGTWWPPPASPRVTCNLIAVSDRSFPPVTQAATQAASDAGAAPAPSRDIVIRVHSQTSPRPGLWWVLRFRPLSTVALKKMSV